MTENVQTAAMPGAPAIEAAAAEFRRALQDGDSVLTPGRPIWTAANAEELLARFNGRPDISGANFEEKLARQLADASPDAVQLFAELYSLDLLPLSDYKPATKRSLVSGTLALAGKATPIPPVLDEAFNVGVLSGGVAFKTRRFFQLSYLIEFAAGFLAMTVDDLARALDDPLEFRSALDAVTTTSAQSQRATLLFLFFPDFFFAIANENHRKRIRAAFADKIGGLTADEDKDLHNIYAALFAETGKPFHFYRSPYKEQWNPSGDSDAGQRAWLVRGNNVNGLDLVPGWLEHGRVALAAT
jgi:5-methylcytosine-specific restriction protein B